MSATHYLKTLPEYWDAIHMGLKTFEVRRDDRGFAPGDFLALHRGTDVSKGSSILMREITYILRGGQFGIEPGFVVMGLR